MADLSKKRTYKCPGNNCSFRDHRIGKLHKHIKEKHDSEIPDGFTLNRWIFMKANGGKINQICTICKKKETLWNEDTMRYNRYCSLACKKKAGEIARKNLKKVYGKENLLNDPKFQQKMLENRKISGTYRFKSDKIEVKYTGSYEEDFLEFVDKERLLKGSDITIPIYKGIVFAYYLKKEDFKDVDYPEEIIEKHLGRKTYTPDYYIENLKLLIEIKDGGTNPNTHHKIMAIDKIKEKKKDEIMLADKGYHYIKICDKNYIMLMSLLKELKYRSISSEKHSGLYKIFS